MPSFAVLLLLSIALSTISVKRLVNIPVLELLKGWEMPSIKLCMIFCRLGSVRSPITRPSEIGLEVRIPEAPLSKLEDELVIVFP